MDEALDRLPGGFLSFSDDSVVMAANRTLAAMLGYERDELLGKHVESLLTVPSRIFYQTHVFPLLKMQEHIEEVYLSARAKDGAEIPVLINGCRIRLGDQHRNECVLIPMRRRNEYEDEILKAKHAAEEATEARDTLNAALEAAHREVVQQRELLCARNAELETISESLEERVQARTADLSQLVKELQGINYSIAHDLRAPLRAIITSSAILMDPAEELNAAEQQELLERQRINGHKLASLVDDLLQLSRLILAPFHSEPLDLSALARSAAKDALASEGRDNIEISIQSDLRAEGDHPMISLLLLNLLENAIRYSPHGGSVAFGATEGTATRVYFVRDEGIGIDPVYAEAVFRPFHRLHRDEDFPGNGIGLANAERIVRRHGGHIWLESAPNDGATFFFTLPS